MNPILTLNNVSYSYHSKEGEISALKNVSFSIKPGSFVSIVGPSGCGKSTLLSLIAGLISPESGSIEVNGVSVSKERMHIGYMLQKDNLFEWRTVYKNILLGLEMNKQCNENKLRFINSMIDNYGLKDFKNKRPSELSGGMRQRAALIRTLAMEPDILLLDEPFSALDYQTRLEVSDDIARIIKEQGKTAVLVTHDLAEAIAMGEQVIVMSNRPGTVSDIINIELSIPERTPLASRSAKEFSYYFNLIWKELANHESDSGKLFKKEEAL